MITKEQMGRINELYKKKTEIGLTEEEAIEQAELRRIYIDSFKQNLKSQLENMEFVEPKAATGGTTDKAHSNKHLHIHKHGKGCGCGCESHNHKH